MGQADKEVFTTDSVHHEVVVVACEHRANNNLVAVRKGYISRKALAQRACSTTTTGQPWLNVHTLPFNSTEGGNALCEPATNFISAALYGSERSNISGTVCSKLMCFHKQRKDICRISDLLDEIKAAVAEFRAQGHTDAEEKLAGEELARRACCGRDVQLSEPWVQKYLATASYAGRKKRRLADTLQAVPQPAMAADVSSPMLHASSASTGTFQELLAGGMMVNPADQDTVDTGSTPPLPISELLERIVSRPAPVTQSPAQQLQMLLATQQASTPAAVPHKQEVFIRSQVQDAFIAATNSQWTSIASAFPSQLLPPPCTFGAVQQQQLTPMPPVHFPPAAPICLADQLKLLTDIAQGTQSNTYAGQQGMVPPIGRPVPGNQVTLAEPLPTQEAPAHQLPFLRTIHAAGEAAASPVNTLHPSKAAVQPSVNSPALMQAAAMQSVGQMAQSATPLTQPAAGPRSTTPSGMVSAAAHHNDVPSLQHAMAAPSTQMPFTSSAGMTAAVALQLQLLLGMAQSASTPLAAKANNTMLASNPSSGIQQHASSVEPLLLSSEPHRQPTAAKRIGNHAQLDAFQAAAAVPHVDPASKQMHDSRHYASPGSLPSTAQQAAMPLPLHIHIPQVLPSSNICDAHLFDEDARLPGISKSTALNGASKAAAEHPLQQACGQSGQPLQANIPASQLSKHIPPQLPLQALMTLQTLAASMLSHSPSHLPASTHSQSSAQLALPVSLTRPLRPPQPVTSPPLASSQPYQAAVALLSLLGAAQPAANMSVGITAPAGMPQASSSDDAAALQAAAGKHTHPPHVGSSSADAGQMPPNFASSTMSALRQHPDQSHASQASAPEPIFVHCTTAVPSAQPLTQQHVTVTQVKPERGSLQLPKMSSRLAPRTRIAMQYQDSDIMLARRKGIRRQEFKIVREIGQGASSRVYEVTCLDESDQYKAAGWKWGFALKLWRTFDDQIEGQQVQAPEPFQNDQDKTFANEKKVVVHITGRLSNSSPVLQYWACGSVESDINGILMQYTVKTLGEVMKHNRQDQSLFIPSVQKYTKQLIQGVMELEDELVIHRDLKASNIGISHEDGLYLADFSLSYLLNNDTSTMYTQVGTCGNEPPEIINGDPYDKMVNPWGVGIVVYEMLMGCLPFFGGRVGMYGGTVTNQTRIDGYLADARHNHLPADAMSFLKGCFKVQAQDWDTLQQLLAHKFVCKLA